MLSIFNIKINNLLLSLAMLILLVACGDSSSTKEEDVKEVEEQTIEGKLIDSIVQGVEYHCGEIIGFTNQDGTFSCITFPISFHIGAINLGKITTLPEDKQIFPQDIVGVDRLDVNNSEVVKIALLLQSFDNDQNASNGIIINSNVGDNFTEEIIVSNLELEILQEVIKDKDENIVFIDTHDVIEHLNLSVNNSNLNGNSSLEEPTAEESSDETNISPTGTTTQTIITQDTTTGTTTLNSTAVADTTAPATNSTLNAINTADSTPALKGNLPHGDDDTHTENYTISIEINGTSYDAVNNKDGNWSIANDTINELQEGFFSVVITVTDEAKNSSSTTINNKIEINNSGFLIDSALEGIKYVSGKYSGYTDENGLFKYEEGAGVTFYIGDESTGILMGNSNAKIDPYNAQRHIITLFDLAGSQDENNAKVINLGKFLQSLDADNDVSNGITIDEKTKEAIALANLKNHLDFDQDVDAFHEDTEVYNLMNDLAGHFGEHRGLRNSEDVKAHLVSVRDNNLSTKTFTADNPVRGVKQELKILTGIFQTTTGIVEGLEYRSGNQFGRTSSTGEFKYEEGKKVKFSIYQLELGTTQGNAVITPANLVVSTSFDHPKPRNIIRLLSVFDSISSDAKVSIDNAVREALEKYRSQIDINLPDGKANAEFSIPAGLDEFGAQFEDFEIGKEILAEITELRGVN